MASCNALPFEDQSIFNEFLRDLGAVTDVLKTMCAKCSEENITGEQFKTFEAIFERVKCRISTIAQNLEDLYVQVRENGSFVPQISHVLGKNLKSKVPVVVTKDFNAIQTLQYEFKSLMNKCEECSKRFKISTIDIEELKDKIKNIFSHIQIAREITPPENQFKSIDMLNEIVEYLSNDEIVVNILKTNEYPTNNDLQHVVEVVYYAVVSYMQKINMDFVFDTKLKFVMQNTAETAHISNYEMLKGKSFFNADLVVSLPKLWDYKEDKSAIETLLNIVSIVVHECGHRLDFLYDSKAFVERQSSPIDKLKELIGLKPDEEMNECDMLFLSCLSPSLKQKLMFGDEDITADEKPKLDMSEVNHRIKHLTARFTAVSYLNKDVEIFARKFSFDMLLGIIAGLKLACHDRDIINNLSGLDSNMFRVFDGAIVCDHEASLSESIYVMTGVKFDKEIEDKIEETLQLNNKIMSEIQDVVSVDSLMSIIYESRRIYGKEGEDLYERGVRTIKAFVAQMPDDKFEKLFMEACRKDQNLIIGLMLSVKPDFYNKLTEEEWVVLISKSGKIGGHLNCEFLELKTEDGSSKAMFERVLKTICESNDLNGVVAFFKNSKISLDVMKYLAEWIEKIPESNKETLEYEKLLNCLKSGLDVKGAVCLHEDYLYLFDILTEETCKYSNVFDKLHQEDIEKVSHTTSIVPLE